MIYAFGVGVRLDGIRVRYPYPRPVISSSPINTSSPPNFQTPPHSSYKRQQRGHSPSSPRPLRSPPPRAPASFHWWGLTFMDSTRWRWRCSNPRSGLKEETRWNSSSFLRNPTPGNPHLRLGFLKRMILYSLSYNASFVVSISEPFLFSDISSP